MHFPAHLNSTLYAHIKATFHSHKIAHLEGFTPPNPASFI